VNFYDDANNKIGWSAIYNPAFADELPKKAIDPGFELIGISLTIDSGGSWLNFLFMPENQPII